MSVDRRDILFGLLAAASAGTAFAIEPRRVVQLMPQRDLEQLVPRGLGAWKPIDNAGIVIPQSDNSLSAKIYAQVLTRGYELAEKQVMLLVAYGKTQSDSLQLHRPETCYPAFGFNLSNVREMPITLEKGVVLPARALTATSPGRTEHILYWTRVGEYLPLSNNEQRLAKLRTQIDGIIPDGVLVRVSNVIDDPVAAQAANVEFVRALVAGLGRSTRAGFVGSNIARQYV